MRQALGRLSDLQRQIDNFMEFLVRIQTMITKGTRNRKIVFESYQGRDDQKNEPEDVTLKKVNL
ncbi:MAG: hypothetical protein CL912_13905 [Deltaproteobacteria bacterium]|nr:hypothetical protein [Deltaproteobacteria bacterium]